MGEIFKIESPRQAWPFDGERYTTAALGAIRFEHLHRYFLARELCRGKRVLDVASGEGFGSAILSQVARSVAGLELSAEVSRHAAENYSRPGLAFASGDARRLPFADGSFDVVVSFETLEHFAESELFLAEIERVLHDDGIVIMSTPDREVYSPAGRKANPYHAREFTRNDFSRLLKARFQSVRFFAQRVIRGSALVAQPSVNGGRLAVFDTRGDDHVEVDSALPRAPYLFALAGRNGLPDLSPGSLLLDGKNDEVTGASGNADREEVLLQVFPFVREGYSAEVAHSTQVRTGAPVEIRFELGELHGPLRLDLADCPAVVNIERLSLCDESSSDPIWTAETPESLAHLELQAETTRLPGMESYRVFCHGFDSQIRLPHIQTAGCVTLHLRVNISSNLAELAGLVADNNRTAPRPLQLQLSLPTGGDFTEEESRKRTIHPDAWNTVHFAASSPLRRGRFRLDLPDFPGVVEIGRIVLLDARTQQILWTTAESPSAFNQVAVEGTAVAMLQGGRFLVVSSGQDTRVLLPDLEFTAGDLRLEVVLRFETRLTSVVNLLAAHDGLGKTNGAAAQASTLRNELRTSEAERIHLTAELKQVAAERDDSMREARQFLRAFEAETARRTALEQTVASLKSRVTEGDSVVRALETALAAASAERDELGGALDAEKDDKRRILESKSWRLTQLPRTLMRSLRSHHATGRH